MQLLTKELRAQLPPLYAQEKTGDPTVYGSLSLPIQAGRGVLRMAGRREETFASLAVSSV
jgi:hypothetical protein